MLRRCLQRASSLSRTSRSWSIATAVAAHPPPLANINNQNRWFGISRHTDPLAPRVDMNAAEDDDGIDSDVKNEIYTADDLEYQEVKHNEEFDEWSDNNEEIIPSFTDDDEATSLLARKKRKLTPEEIEYQERQARIQEELNSRTGRLWEERWVITDEEWMSTDTWEDIEDWSLNMATRKALESVQVWDAGVPTLQQMSQLHLPPPLPPHPGHGTPSIHASYRKKKLNKRLQTSIQLSIADDLAKILTMTSWEDKQEAVDELFEVVEERVREKEPVLAKLPDFKERVEDGLEQVLRMVQSRVRGVKKAAAAADAGTASVEATDEETTSAPPELAKEDIEKAIDVMGTKEEPPVPVFMDILKAARRQPQSTSDESTYDSSPKKTLSEFFTKSNDADVPNLIYPLNVHHNDGIGRMVEEWQLAASKETKRIMMRDGMKVIASKIVEAANCCSGEVGEEEKGAARVFVTGKRGVGKTAALAGLVASARISGHIVFYLPDGDRLRKHGFYIEPSNHRKGLYELPEIAKEFCEQLLTSHGADLDEIQITISRENMNEYLSADQITRLFTRASDENTNYEESSELTLSKILDVGIGSTSLASGCYGMVIDALMNQTKKPFTVVMDEFNCYYDHGHFFHMDYDDNVRKAIPINKITIFKPFMDAMGLYPSLAGNEIAPDDSTTKNYTTMKWGSMIVATSESRAVRKTFTQSLTESAHAKAQSESSFHVVDLQRFNDVEVQHILYNFECTGIGRLRFDRGYTTLNPEEVSYLQMVSGGLGQPLLDACMLP